MYSCSGVFGILVRRYLVGLVESVDAGVAENAKRLWLGEAPTANSVGRPSDKGGGTTIKEKNDTDHVLARLKRDHPDLAQQVIDGDISATKAAQVVGARIVRSGSRLKERAIYDL